MADRITITVDTQTLSNALNAILFRVEDLEQEQRQVAGDNAAIKRTRFAIDMYREAYNDLLDSMP